jgi:hypothetical protein
MARKRPSTWAKAARDDVGFAGVSAPAFAICLCIALAACAGFPDVAALEGPAGPPPPLLPLDGLLPEPAPQADPALALTARADALRSRAGAIGAP